MRKCLPLVLLVAIAASVIGYITWQGICGDRQTAAGRRAPGPSARSAKRIGARRAAAEEFFREDGTPPMPMREGRNPEEVSGHSDTSRHAPESK